MTLRRRTDLCPEAIINQVKVRKKPKQKNNEKINDFSHIRKNNNILQEILFKKRTLDKVRKERRNCPEASKGPGLLEC